jgi:hypothetical protein
VFFLSFLFLFVFPVHPRISTILTGGHPIFPFTRSWLQALLSVLGLRLLLHGEPLHGLLREALLVG